MASSKTRLNYDELNLILKQFRHESNDIAHLHSATRHKIQALRGEWTGRAADAFIEELEGRLLPALHRTAQALDTSETVLNQIMKTIHEADMETAGYFNGFADTIGRNPTPIHSPIPALPWLKGIKVDGLWGKDHANIGDKPELDVKFGVKEGQIYDGGTYQIGKWGGGLEVGLGDKGFSAGLYGEYDTFKSEINHVTGSSMFGFTVTDTLKAGSVDGFAGIKDNDLGFKIGGSVADIERGLGLNIAGINIRVTGGLLFGGMEYGAQVGDDISANFGPFKLGLSFGKALTDTVSGQ